MNFWKISGPSLSLMRNCSSTLWLCCNKISSSSMLWQMLRSCLLRATRALLKSWFCWSLEQFCQTSSKLLSWMLARMSSMLARKRWIKKLVISLSRA